MTPESMSGSICSRASSDREPPWRSDTTDQIHRHQEGLDHGGETGIGQAIESLLTDALGIDTVAASGAAQAVREGLKLGRCRLQSQIGSGSMGVVWKAWHTTLEIPVAVKILRKPACERESAVFQERFRLEARNGARVNHPNLVRILDFGEEGGLQYLVMEWVDGTTLEHWLRRRKPCSERTALKAIGHICTGLAELHRAGIVHRDIKPSNILVEPGRSLKISDLGLARDAASNRPMEVAGTPHFMAPECLQADRPFDPRSDLYAVGVILYRMVMGRMPFSGSTREVLKGQLDLQPDWTLPEGTIVDEGTMDLLRRLLEKEPERRIQTALEAIQACRDQRRRLKMLAGVGAEGPEPAAGTVTETIPEAGGRKLPARNWMTIRWTVLSAAMPEWVPWAMGGTVLATLLLSAASFAMK